MDNPVYYVQMAHARLASILAKAAEDGAPPPADDLAGLAALGLDDERQLAMALARYPETIRRAADAREPHLVAFSLLELAREFHGYYQRNKKTDRVITDDDATTAARLALVAAVRQVMANGLALLGVTAPDRMVDLSALEGDTDADADADANADADADEAP
jgi:arginyl-tRNA synthetase